MGSDVPSPCTMSPWPFHLPTQRYLRTCVLLTGCAFVLSVALLRPHQRVFRRIQHQNPKPPSPSAQTKVTIVGKNEIYKRENLVRLFLVHKLLGPKPPPPPLKRRPGPHRSLDSRAGGNTGGRFLGRPVQTVGDHVSPPASCAAGSRVVVGAGLWSWKEVQALDSGP